MFKRCGGYSCRLDNCIFKHFTILVDGEIVGSVLYRCKGSTPFIEKLNDDEYYLTRIYVKLDCQCRGIGKQAILLCEKEFCNATKFYVDFPIELVKNRKCYENAGFYSSGKKLVAEQGLSWAHTKKDCFINFNLFNWILKHYLIRNNHRDFGLNNYI